MTHPRVAALDRPGVVAVHGPDAVSFLQSMVSQDLDGLAVGETRDSLLLTPQGKLTALFHVTRVADEEVLLDCAPEIAPALADALNRFRIRVNSEVHDRTGQYVAVRERGGNEPSRNQLVPVDAPLPNVDAPLIDAQEWEALRIVRGEPRQPLDVDESTIAQEAFLDRTAVSFTKGCFLGQELVCRIDARGHVNRLLRGLRSATPLAPGVELFRDGAVVGRVTSSAHHPEFGHVALGMLRREVEPPAVVHTTEGSDVHVIAV